MSLLCACMPRAMTHAHQVRGHKTADSHEASAYSPVLFPDGAGGVCSCLNLGDYQFIRQAYVFLQLDTR